MGQVAQSLRTFNPQQFFRFLSGLHCMKDMKVQRNHDLIDSSLNIDLPIGGATISYQLLYRQDENLILWLEAVFVVVIERCQMCAFKDKCQLVWPRTSTTCKILQCD